MGSKSKNTEDDVYVSCLSGRGIYRSSGRFVKDPVVGGADSPLITNLLTGEEYFLRAFSCKTDRIKTIKKRVRHPADGDVILWPKDYVILSEAQSRVCTLKTYANYSAQPMPAETADNNYAAVFPFRSYPERANLGSRLSVLEPRSWKQKETVRLAANILYAFERLNRDGYLYFDIHPSRIMVDGTGKVFLDYTDLLLSIEEAADIYRGAKPPIAFEKGAYPIEFAEPAVVLGSIKGFDFQSQNYEIASLLFYILFDRYPYDGRLMSDYVDNSVQHHYLKFNAYHQQAVFIFDPYDKENALGAFEDERHIIELWNSCPDCIKQLFIRTLSTDNALRKIHYDNPTAGQWLSAFKEAGWLN